MNNPASIANMEQWSRMIPDNDLHVYLHPSTPIHMCPHICKTHTTIHTSTISNRGKITLIYLLLDIKQNLITWTLFCMFFRCSFLIKILHMILMILSLLYSQESEWSVFILYFSQTYERYLLLSKSDCGRQNIGIQKLNPHAPLLPEKTVLTNAEITMSHAIWLLCKS